MPVEITNWKLFMTIHPPILLIYFARSLTGTIQSDFIINYVCLYKFNNASYCELLHNNSTSEETKALHSIIQPEVAKIFMFKLFIDSLLPAFLLLFLGAWSDKNGRKPLLIAGYLGLILNYVALIGFAFIKLNPLYILLSFVPPAMLGGFSTLMISTFSYVTDITANEKRTWQLVCLEAVMSIGTLAGIFSGLSFKYFGYVLMFSMAILCCLLALIFICTMVPETVNKTISNRRYSTMELIRSLFAVIFKRRPHFNKYIVFCCIVILTINVLIIEGEWQVAFLFTSAKLGWKVEDFSLWLGINVLAGIFGTLIGGRYLKKIFGISNISVVILANFSPLSGAIVKSFANSSWHMYLAIVLGIFGDVTRPLIRTQISTSGPKEDVGKLFSINAFFETLITFAAGPLYSMVYAHSMPPTYPCPVWYVSVALYSFIIILAIVIKRQLHSESVLINENDSN